MKGRRRNLNGDEQAAVDYWCTGATYEYSGTITKKEAIELQKLVPFIPSGMHFIAASMLTCIGVSVVMLVSFGLQISDHDRGFAFISSLVGIPALYIYWVVTLRNEWDEKNPA